MDISNDIGHRETEDVLEELEKRIAAEYRQAEVEVQEKLEKYLERFEKKDKVKLQQLQQGLITQAEYDQWKIGQIAMGQRWADMRNQLAEDFTNTDKIAKATAFGYMPEVYAINHNYGTYQVEMLAKVDTKYTLYDRSTVQRLFDDNQTFYPAPGKKISAAIKQGKALAWNKKQVQSAMIQAILQGESMDKIAKRVAKTVGEKDKNAAIRNARTMTTGVQNAGRVNSYKRAQQMGIKLEQEWLATLDGRTRHEHRILDGQRAPVGKPFEVEGYKIEYPGDPTAAAHLIYNCRCTLVPALDKFAPSSTDLSLRNTNHMEEQTYGQWKYRHQRDIMNKYSGKAKVQKDYEEWKKKTVINPVTIACEKAGVQKLGVKMLENPLNEEEIIKKLGGGDMTEGSCMSLALAYAANKNGLDVLDFRGEPSRYTIATKYPAIAKLPGVKAYRDYGKNDITVCKRLMKNMEPNKEYILISGKHAAVVRSYDGSMKYAEWLELQSPNDNGYRFFAGDDVEKDLRKRFACRKYGTKLKNSYLIEIDSLKDNDNFRAILEYVNTEPSKQKKGVRGSAK